MRQQAIFHADAKQSFHFIQTCWKQAHQDKDSQTELSIPYPLQGTEEPYGFSLWRLLYGSRVVVGGFSEADFDCQTYERQLNNHTFSPLYQPTLSSIKQIVNYLNRKRHDYFRRESNTSHPRYLLGLYFCLRLLDLAKQQIVEPLIKSYESEQLFLHLIFQKADTYLPTSAHNAGRDGFHALLLTIDSDFTNCLHITKAYLERKTIKELVENLRILCNNFMSTCIEKIPYLLSDLAFTEIFTLEDLVKNPWRLDALRNSVVGKWLLLLAATPITDLAEFKMRSNPWLTQLDDSIRQLSAERSLATPLKTAATLKALCQLFGFLFELQGLSLLLDLLAECAGLFGDFTLVFNDTFSNILIKALNCWNKQSTQIVAAIHLIHTITREELKKQPGTQAAWNANHKHCWGLNADLKNLVANSEVTIKKIFDACNRLLLIGTSGCHATLKSLQQHTASYLERQIALGILPQPEVHYSVLGRSRKKAGSRKIESIRGLCMPQIKPETATAIHNAKTEINSSLSELEAQIKKHIIPGFFSSYKPDAPTISRLLDPHNAGNIGLLQELLSKLTGDEKTSIHFNAIKNSDPKLWKIDPGSKRNFLYDQIELLFLYRFLQAKIEELEKFLIFLADAINRRVVDLSLPYSLDDQKNLARGLFWLQVLNNGGVLNGNKQTVLDLAALLRQQQGNTRPIADDLTALVKAQLGYSVATTANENLSKLLFDPLVTAATAELKPERINSVAGLGAELKGRADAEQRAQHRHVDEIPEVVVISTPLPSVEELELYFGQNPVPTELQNIYIHAKTLIGDAKKANDISDKSTSYTATGYRKGYHLWLMVQDLMQNQDPNQKSAIIAKHKAMDFKGRYETTKLKITDHRSTCCLFRMVTVTTKDHLDKLEKTYAAPRQ